MPGIMEQDLVETTRTGPVQTIDEHGTTDEEYLQLLRDTSWLGFEAAV